MFAVRADHLSQHQWQKMLGRAGYYAFQQHWAYGEAVKGFGGGVWRAALYHDGEPVALAQIQLRRVLRFATLALCMRGPVWLAALSDAEKAEAYRLLRAALPVRAPRLALFMPETEDDAALQLAGRRRVVTGYATALLDLTQPPDALLAACDGKWRNRLKAGQVSGLQIDILPARYEDYAFLLEYEAAQSRRIGYSALHPAFVPAWQHHAGADKPLCLSAREGGRIVAAVLCLVHAPHATYHIGWSDARGKALNAHNVLLWRAAERLKARGIRCFDLGGVNTEEGAGIARFKLGTGAGVKILPGTYL